MTPLDVERLALRIETLQRTSTEGWHPGDENEFKASLPGASSVKALPDPTWLREQAKDPSKVQALKGSWAATIQRVLSLEHLVRRNRPGSPQRAIRDMQRGKFPFKR